MIILLGRPFSLRGRSTSRQGAPFPSATTAERAFVIMDRLLNNASTGPQYLCREEFAQIVVDAIRYSDGRQYDLHHFVVLPE